MNINFYTLPLLFKNDLLIIYFHLFINNLSMYLCVYKFEFKNKHYSHIFCVRIHLGFYFYLNSI